MRLSVCDRRCVWRCGADVVLYKCRRLLQFPTTLREGFLCGGQVLLICLNATARPVPGTSGSKIKAECANSTASLMVPRLRLPLAARVTAYAAWGVGCVTRHCDFNVTTATATQTQTQTQTALHMRVASGICVPPMDQDQVAWIEYTAPGSLSSGCQFCVVCCAVGQDRHQIPPSMMVCKGTPGRRFDGVCSASLPTSLSTRWHTGGVAAGVWAGTETTHRVEPPAPRIQPQLSCTY